MLLLALSVQACGNPSPEPNADIPETIVDAESTDDALTDTSAGQDVINTPDAPTLDVNTDDGHADFDTIESDLPIQEDSSWDSLADTIDLDAPADVGPTDTYIEPEIPEHGDLKGTGFFRVQAHSGRWWFVTPEGDPFYSVGINACTPNGSVDATTGVNRYNDAVRARYADYDEWANTTANRLQSWGFNTIGAWSDWSRLGKAMPYTIILNISGVDWQVGDVPDYFSDEFAARCDQVATQTVAPRRDDPMLLGWFLDNELRWGWDWRSPKTLLADYLAMPETTPGRKIAESYRGDPEGFLKAVASRYFFITTTAVRKADPNHMILGIRSISVMTHPQVPQAAGPWVDVYSVNNYEFVPVLYESIDAAGQDFLDESNWLVEYYKITGRPILITEYSMRSAEADVPSTWPIFYPTYPTQVDRAAAWEAYSRQCFAKPYIIGQHWFQWTDEPYGGRFDGENSNFGLVDGDDNPYEVLTSTMARVHAEAPDRIAR